MNGTGSHVHHVDPHLLGIDWQQVDRLRYGDHHDPHSILGAHPANIHGQDGVIIRSYHPECNGSVVLMDGVEPQPLQGLGHGLFAGFFPGGRLPADYRLRLYFPHGPVWERDDPYRFTPTVSDLDLHLYNEGTHRRAYQALGAHPRLVNGVWGTSFAVWAPSARRVSLIGDFNSWDGRAYPMRSLGSSGVWEIFVPGVGPGALYKFEIKTQVGDLRIKTDPYAFEMECPPATASRVAMSNYQWGDHDWMTGRPKRDVRREPMTVYEVHLGSWARVPEDGQRWLNYRELAPRLVDHVKRLNFTHIELMPVAEHPLTASWGYQVTGYYAPTARYGTPDDFRYFVDYCHQHGIGVILDWVPAHFPKDDFALRRFDGTALYEHEDWRRGEHPDWGTLIFNYSRAEVRSFLVANAVYWAKELHIDGLRVDAVASMLYLDYSRKEGEWIPNQYGGRENIDAIDLLRAFNCAVADEAPGAFTIAEESTSWGGVTNSPEHGGLGFTLKWNMGWMHDTLQFMSKEPIHRKYHVNDFTFAMLYEFTERFINSISHDEVVHGKRSLIEKMPGDFWQKLANVRLLLTYQYLRPGKQLLFMGTEFGQHNEWYFDASLDWHLAEHPQRRALQEFVKELGWLYRSEPVFWASDPDPHSFEWIDCSDRESTIMSFIRRHGDDLAVVVLNFTPVPRENYRLGVPLMGRWVERLSSNDPRFGGSEYQTTRAADAEEVEWHWRPQSILIQVPPLAGLVLVPERKG
jgi:1,4-alpha-glucan branching enzyme